MNRCTYDIRILDYIIYIFLLFYLVVDTANGILLRNYHVSIAVPYKMVMLILMMLSIAVKDKNRLCLILFYALLSFICLLSYFNNYLVNYSESVSTMIKLISIPCFFYYFFLLSKFDKKNSYRFKTIMNVNLMVFLSNIFAGILGFGYYAYGWAKIGIEGFFFAGNEVAVLFFCLYYYVLSRINGKTKYILLVYILSFFISVLMATKTAVLACFLFSFIDYYYRLTGKGKMFFKIVFPALVLGLSVLGVCLLPKTTFYQYVEGQVLHHLKHGSGLLNIVLSGRAERIGPTFSLWENTFSLSQFLFGMGFVAQASSDGHINTSSIFIRRLEIDPLETFFYFGIIFFFLMLFFYIHIIRRCVIKKHKKLFFFNLMFLFISFTAGHTWVSVMSGVFFAYINAYELVGKNEYIQYN